MGLKYVNVKKHSNKEDIKGVSQHMLLFIHFLNMHFGYGLSSVSRTKDINLPILQILFLFSLGKEAIYG